MLAPETLRRENRLASLSSKTRLEGAASSTPSSVWGAEFARGAAAGVGVGAFAAADNSRRAAAGAATAGSGARTAKTAGAGATAGDGGGTGATAGSTSVSGCVGFFWPSLPASSSATRQNLPPDDYDDDE